MPWRRVLGMLGMLVSCGQAAPAPTPAPAPAPAPEVARVALTPEVRAALDSTWLRSAFANVEIGVCVASRGYVWDATRRVARVWRLALTGPQAARIDSSDALNLWWRDDICGDTLPSWHSHLNAVHSVPSLCDRQQFAWRSTAPFWLVQSAPGVLHVIVLDSVERQELRKARASAC